MIQWPAPAGTVADQSTAEDTPLTVAKALILAAASDLEGDTLSITTVPPARDVQVAPLHRR